jgi:putative tricarboxylic transport membrane protein
MPPLILAFVLGGMMEENLRRSLLISDGSFNFLWDRPLTAVILAGTILLVAGRSIRVLKNNCKRINLIYCVFL